MIAQVHGFESAPGQAPGSKSPLSALCKCIDKRRKFQTGIFLQKMTAFQSCMGPATGQGNSLNCICIPTAGDWGREKSIGSLLSCLHKRGEFGPACRPGNGVSVFDPGTAYRLYRITTSRLMSLIVATRLVSKMWSCLSFTW